MLPHQTGGLTPTSSYQCWGVKGHCPQVSCDILAICVSLCAEGAGDGDLQTLPRSIAIAAGFQVGAASVRRLEGGKKEKAPALFLLVASLVQQQ